MRGLSAAAPPIAGRRFHSLDERIVRGDER